MYVVPNVDFEDWNEEFAREHASKSNVRWCKRPAALIMAHNVENKGNTEFGVREIFLMRPSKKTAAKSEQLEFEDF